MDSCLFVNQTRFDVEQYMSQARGGRVLSQPRGLGASPSRKQAGRTLDRWHVSSDDSGRSVRSGADRTNGTELRPLREIRKKH